MTSRRLLAVAGGALGALALAGCPIWLNFNDVGTQSAATTSTTTTSGTTGGGGTTSTSGTGGTGGTTSTSGGGGVGGTTSTGAGGGDAGTTGPLWAKQFGDMAGQIGRAIATDALGNVLVGGLSQDGAVDFGGGASGDPNVAIVVAKLDTGGGYVWSKGFVYANGGGIPSDEPLALAVDANSNVIVASAANGPIDFGCGTLTSPPTNPAALVAKLDANGNCVWSKAFGGGEAQAVASDSAGNVIVAGSFSGMIDLGCGALSIAAAEGTFFAQLDENGACVWSQSYGATTLPSLGVDGMDDVILTGGFSGDLDFGGAPMTSAGAEDMFIAAFDQGGGYRWSGGWGSVGSSITSSGVAVDHDGDVVIAGQLWGAVSFGTEALTSANGAASFAAKFDESGAYLWASSFGSMQVNGAMPAPAVTVDAAGNIWLTGNMVSDADFGGGTLTSAGGTDAFIARLAPTGTYLWARNFGDAQDQSGLGVATDSLGNAFVVGAFAGSMNFGVSTLMSVGSSNIFVAKLSP